MRQREAGGVHKAAITRGSGRSSRLPRPPSSSQASSGRRRPRPRRVAPSTPRPAAPTPPPARSPPRFRTAQRLVESLSAGETGCLRAGTYDENVNIREGGAAGAPADPAQLPGGAGEVVGILYVARTAPHVTVEDLYLNGRNPEGRAEPAGERRRHRLPQQRRDQRPHRHLLHPRRHEYGPRHPDADRAQPHPRLRPAALRPTSTTASMSPRRTTCGSRTTGSTTTPTGASTSTPTRSAPWSRATSSRATARASSSPARAAASSDNLVQGNVITGSKLRFNIDSLVGGRQPGRAGNVVSRNCVSRWSRRTRETGESRSPRSASRWKEPSPPTPPSSIGRRRTSGWRMPARAGTSCRPTCQRGGAAEPTPAPVLRRSAERTCA